MVLMPNLLKSAIVLIIIVGALSFIYQQQVKEMVLAVQDSQGFDDSIEPIIEVKELSKDFFDQKYQDTVQKYLAPQVNTNEKISDTDQAEIQKTNYLTELRYRALLSSVQAALDKILEDNAFEFSNATAETNKLFGQFQTASQKVAEIKTKLDQFSANSQNLTDIDKLKDTVAQNQTISTEIKTLFDQLLSLFSKEDDGLTDSTGIN